MNDTHGAQSGNFLASLPAPLEGEVFEDILRCRNVRIERIVSSDRPDPTPYDQDHDEWVCLLQGDAELWIAGATVSLKTGDYCFIPAHTPHRLVRTSSRPRCVWLAVHIA